MERRPIKSRDAAPIRWLASLLASTSITANQISAASIGFAVFGSALLLMYVSSVTLVIMAVCIQLRLLGWSPLKVGSKARSVPFSMKSLTDCVT
jgi:hypothetical protein